jgi:hypothetical protein
MKILLCALFCFHLSSFILRYQSDITKNYTNSISNNVNYKIFYTFVS